MHSRTLSCAAFLALQLVVGVTWFCTLTPLAKQVGLASVGMVGTYPLMKRVTHWPQVGLTGGHWEWQSFARGLEITRPLVIDAWDCTLKVAFSPPA